MTEIPLAGGLVALVDDEDEFIVSQFAWHAVTRGRSIYAESNRWSRSEKKLIPVKMHRVVLRVWDAAVKVDHIDHDGLNNQKSNLRLVTLQENARNSRAALSGASPFKGVMWSTRKAKWFVKIGIDIGNRLYIGEFHDQVVAARAYNYAAPKFHGEHAHLNDVEDDPSMYERFERMLVKRAWTHRKKRAA